MCLRGKATFRHLSRRPFDFVEFNRLCVADILKFTDLEWVREIEGVPIYTRVVHTQGI